MHIPRQAPGAGPPGPDASQVDGGTLQGFPAAEMSAASKQIVTVPTTTELPGAAKPHKNNVNGVAIAIPIVVGVAVLLAFVFLYYKYRRTNIFARQPTLTTRGGGTPIPPPATERTRASRREERRLAALRRTDSGRSVATLPTYKVEPGDDEELIVLKRIESGSDLSHAPAYDDTPPLPEHPPTWSEIHGHGTSPDSPTSGRSPWRSLSLRSQKPAESTEFGANPYAPRSPRSPLSPSRPDSPHSSAWSTSTSSDEEEEEVRTSRARRIVGESSGRLLGSSSLRKHLQRNSSFRLSPATSRMSSIRSVFSNRAPQSLGHGRPGIAGDSVEGLLPRTQEQQEDEEEVLDEEVEEGTGEQRPRTAEGRTDAAKVLTGRATAEVGRSASEKTSRRAKLQRKSTA